ncbi:MAG: serine hydrolase [Gammaproteobacteria bacterium]|nr:serine hydrolase [Gammaproteobacteria bacterium]
MAVVVEGYCDEKFASVRELFASNIEEDRDVGASLALTIDGEMVIDIWGGHLDEGRTQPWQQDTIVNVYSTTKTMSFLCALVLADRGQLNFDANVADYWPEFAAAGKENVKVWHIMDHAAGLSGMDVAVTPEDLYDWEKIVNLLAEQAPWWEPGTATAYHALTQGYLIGEVVRRITGVSIGTFFQNEIAGPLAADFYIGVPESEFARIGNLFPAGDGRLHGTEDDPDSIASRTFSNPFSPALYSHTEGWRKAEIPAANGHSNARSVARLQAPLACGGSAFGVDLFSRATAESVMQERISGLDLALGVPIAFGLGFALNSEVVPLSPNKNTCFWGGWGGSRVLIDQDARLSVSFIMNKMFEGLLGDVRSYRMVQAMYENLD